MSSAAPFLPQEFIRRKRDNLPLNTGDIRQFIAGFTDGSVTDAQISAFAMAVFFNGMSPREGADLTLAMRSSGDVINWTALGFDPAAPIVDKHSTGGVGDKVSLMLAPIVAACGGYVPMISGRGLGHTGGTLDKLQAIPGYDATPDIDRFAAIVRDVGCSIIGQTGALAPADRKFYGIRDVTATVESIPLITASILSKKLAAGLSALVMDVKFGNGAFMADYDQARALAENIVRVAREAGLPTTAVMTDMNQVLGRTAGNAIEILESIQFLQGPASADPRLMKVTLDLAAEMLHLAGLQPSTTAALEAAATALSSGRAAEVFAAMVHAHGGPADLMDAPDNYLQLAPVTLPVHAPVTGCLHQTDTRAIGNAVIVLGGGRTNPADDVNPAVGLSDIQPPGTMLDTQTPFCLIHAENEKQAKAAAAMIEGALGTCGAAPDPAPVTRDIIKT